MSQIGWEAEILNTVKTEFYVTPRFLASISESTLSQKRAGV